MIYESLAQIVSAISELAPKPEVRAALQAALDQQILVTNIVEEGLRRGLTLVGERYERGEYFLAELLYGGQLIQDAFDMLKPHLQQATITKKGLILLGAVDGDLHDIGKNVFKTLAEIAGFIVIDLGVDVDSPTFLQAIKDHSPAILGLSFLLTTVTPSARQLINDITVAGLREGLKILIGGNAADSVLAAQIGADAAALDAFEGVKICQSWM